MDKEILGSLIRFFKYQVHKYSIEEGIEKNRIYDNKHLVKLGNVSKKEFKIGEEYLSIGVNNPIYEEVLKLKKYIQSEGAAYEIDLVLGAIRINKNELFPYKSYEVDIIENRKNKDLTIYIRENLKFDIDDYHYKMGFNKKRLKRYDDKDSYIDTEFLILRKRKDNLQIDSMNELITNMEEGLNDGGKPVSSLKYLAGNKIELDGGKISLSTYYDSGQNRFIDESYDKGIKFVEGGAGSGKTEVVSHLLVKNILEDKKVLYVSRNRFAMEDFYNKLPEIIKEDTVFIEDEKSLNDIKNRVNPNYTEVTIEPLIRQLRSSRFMVKAGGKRQELIDEVKKIKWIDDDLGSTAECPLKNFEMSEMINIIKYENLQELEFYLSNMFIIEEIAALLNIEDKLQEEGKTKTGINDDKINLLNNWAIIDSEEFNLDTMIPKIKEYEEKLSEYYTGIPMELLEKYRNDQSSFNKTASVLNELVEYLNLISEYNEKLGYIRDDIYKPCYMKLLKIAFKNANENKGRIFKRKDDSLLFGEIYRRTKSIDKSCEVLGLLIKEEEAINKVHELFDIIFDNTNIKISDSFTSKEIGEYLILLEQLGKFQNYKRQGSKLFYSLRGITNFEEVNMLSGKVSSELEKVLEAKEMDENHTIINAKLKSISFKTVNNKVFEKLNDDIENFNVEGILEEAYKFTDISNKSVTASKYRNYSNKMRSIMPLTYSKILFSADIDKYLDIENAFLYAKNKDKIEGNIKKIDDDKLDGFAKDRILNKKNDFEYKRWIDSFINVGKGRSKNYYTNVDRTQLMFEEALVNKNLWIMDLLKVNQGVDISKTYFDLIVIDGAEAIESRMLWLLNLAKEAIVVMGDSKENISEPNPHIKKSYLPKGEFTNVDMSLGTFLRSNFDISHLLTNNYREEVEKYVYKVNGKRADKENSNEIEAKKIIEDINNNRKAYLSKNYSIGIVSLFGYKQKNFIERFMLSHLDKELINKCRILVGEINDFQGVERDIIYMSMVVSDNKKFMPLTREEDKQKYKYIQTRARICNKIYYSFDVNKLKNDSCRKSLIESIKICNSEMNCKYYSSVRDSKVNDYAEVYGDNICCITNDNNRYNNSYD